MNRRTLLTLLATIAGSCTQIPGVPPLAVTALACLSSFFVGWAHMDPNGGIATGGGK